MFETHPDYRELLNAAGVTSYDAAAALEPTDRYFEKQGRSTGRYRLEVAGQKLSVYVKKHFRLPWWQRSWAALASFPGPAEAKNLETATALGVRVPDVVFVGAMRDQACASVLAVRELEDYLPLHEYIPGPLAKLPEPARRRRKQALIARMVDVARRLHGNHYYHLDFYLCHFYLRDDATAPDGFDLVMIDFGRLLRSRLPRWRVKDLAGLLFSSDVPGVSRTDRMRFYQQYLGVKKLDEPAKRLARRILAKDARYRRHNDARRAA